MCQTKRWKPISHFVSSVVVLGAALDRSAKNLHMPDALKVPRSGSVSRRPGEESGAETSAPLMRISPEVEA